MPRSSVEVKRTKAIPPVVLEPDDEIAPHLEALEDGREVAEKDLGEPVIEVADDEIAAHAELAPAVAERPRRRTPVRKAGKAARRPARPARRCC
jgi:hypothetical protein